MIKYEKIKGYAEYVSVKYDMLMPVPENCSMVEAAAIPEAFATAYLNLFIEGNIKEGNTLLMNAGVMSECVLKDLTSAYYILPDCYYNVFFCVSTTSWLK